MKRSKSYERTKFPPEVIKAADAALIARSAPNAKTDVRLDIGRGSEDWTHDNLEEFYADYRGDISSAVFERSVYGGARLYVYMSPYWTTQVTVSDADRAGIHSIFEVFEAAAEASRLPADPKPQPPTRRPVVFIGHGRSKQWRDLKDHLTDKHGIQVEAYEVGSRAGHAVRDILDEMLNKSSMALLVLTGEDETEDGEKRARQNVVHETGLFQGRLGFSRAIILLEEGCEEFSNIHGIEQLRFSKGKIREIFGDVLAVLRREFPGALS